MIRPLSEQVVVITGASSGIGRCAAEHLAARGARVVLTARRAAALRALVERIEAQGGTAVAVPGDLTGEGHLQRVADRALAEFGRIDTWVNNASVYIQGTAQNTTLDEFRRVLDVNLIGYIDGSKRALEPMLEQGGGVIIQVSSVLALRGGPNFSGYAAGKGGIDGFSESLRAELRGTGVEVCVLYLPMVDTPIYHHARGKSGTIPKPPPPVLDPLTVAEAIAELAERPRARRTLGLFGHFYAGVSLLPPSLSDWFLRHTSGFARSDIPDTGDNLDAPLPGPGRVRAGWSERGYKGITLRETVRVLPWESLLAAAATGFVLARVGKRR